MYTEKTDNELLDLLEQHKMLTFESQLQLKKELVRRGIECDKEALETTILNKRTDIEKLAYLKDFGFTADFNENGVVVTRTLNAMVTDIVAVLMGLLLFGIGVYGIGSLAAMFINGNEINVISLAINLALSSLLFTGIKFFNGFKRLWDYAGFSLSNLEGVITLKKRFDIKLEKVMENASKLFLEENENEMVLKLGKNTVFSTNAENLTQRMTLEELIKTLQKKA
ncbi:hypothetical protein [Maribacter sp. 2210JD10-5]|uniref:hypothetical protein n=1 Tax=Maribacter sp. 2210JD10-5 TaxID=3386272 RepID=UPI0039BD646C